MAEKEVKFVAVARRSDKLILASRVHTADKSYVSLPAFWAIERNTLDKPAERHRISRAM